MYRSSPVTAPAALCLSPAAVIVTEPPVVTLVGFTLTVLLAALAVAGTDTVVTVRVVVFVSVEPNTSFHVLPFQVCFWKVAVMV